MRLEEAKPMDLERPTQFVDRQHPTTIRSPGRDEPAAGRVLHQAAED